MLLRRAASQLFYRLYHLPSFHAHACYDDADTTPPEALITTMGAGLRLEAAAHRHYADETPLIFDAFTSTGRLHELISAHIRSALIG